MKNHDKTIDVIPSSDSILPRRSMSIDEKHQLTVELSKLSLDILQDLAIHFHLPQKKKQFEVDINSLPDDVLWKIRNYIRHTIIEYDRYRFLIMNAPNNATLESYLDILKENNIKDIVRTCESTYSKETLDKIGIAVHEWRYGDGDVPSSQVINTWIDLVDKVFSKKKTGSNIQETPSTIAVHCIAGLGRAPTLVAIALIQKGMDNYECVEFIRSKRHGAINKKQLDFLLSYKPKKRQTFRRIKDRIGKVFFSKE